MKLKNINIYFIDRDLRFVDSVYEELKSNKLYNVGVYNNNELFFRELIRNPFIAGRHLIIVIADHIEKTNPNTKSGIEVLRIIKGLKKIKSDVIMLTEKDDPIISEKASRLGARYVIPKNDNTHIRLKNAIQMIISQKLLQKEKTWHLLARYVFVSLLSICILVLLHFYFTS